MKRPGDQRIRRNGRRGSSLVGVVAGLMLVAPVHAQTTDQVDLKAAIAAYEAGDLQGALSLLQATPALLNTHDSAVRSVYRGLAYFALGDRSEAEASFARAVRTEPSIRLDPSVHSPSRVEAFDLVRARVVEEWRIGARAADAGGDRAGALAQWRTVLAAAPDDAEARGRVAQLDQLEGVRIERERQAEADRLADGQRQLDAQRQREALQAAADSAAAKTEEAAPGPARTRRKNPGQALAMGLIVPGLGQMYAGRSGLGLLALAGAGGAIAAGYLTQRVDVSCGSVPSNNSCPAGDVLGEATKRPYLAPAVAAAAGITLLAAIDGMLAARRANTRVDGAVDVSGDQDGIRIVAPSLTTDGRTLRAEWVRLRFH
jgi:tetratricopeptide (TPR) repeat protein